MDAPDRCIQCNTEIASHVDAGWLWEYFPHTGWNQVGPFHIPEANELVAEEPERFRHDEPDERPIVDLSPAAHAARQARVRFTLIHYALQEQGS